MESTASNPVGMMSSSVTARASEAVELNVFCSGAFYAVIEELGPAYEALCGNKVNLFSASSMGASPTAIRPRLQRGECAELLIMARSALDDLVAEGLALPGSCVDLVYSKIGMVVKAGAPRPDISTREGFERALMEARSIGYSASASGKYLAKEGFAKLGQPRYGQVMAKAREIVKDRVGTWVATGDPEIGFQQVSELLPIPGTEFVGTLPAPYQQVTIFSVGIATNARHIDEARQLIAYLRSSAAFAAIRKWGMEPAAGWES